MFGAELRAVGPDAERIEKSLEELRSEGHVRIERVAPTLEDVFVHTMNENPGNEHRGPAA
jgi:hypothetical protein